MFWGRTGPCPRCWPACNQPCVCISDLQLGRAIGDTALAGHCWDFRLSCASATLRCLECSSLADSKLTKSRRNALATRCFSGRLGHCWFLTWRARIRVLTARGLHIRMGRLHGGSMSLLPSPYGVLRLRILCCFDSSPTAPASPSSDSLLGGSSSSEKEGS